MNFNELCRKRYSVRAYKPDAVEEEKLQQVLEAAILAPTAVNKQPFRLIVAHTDKNRQELARIYHREWFTQAPILICACAVPQEGYVGKYDNLNHSREDVCIAMTHMILAATDLGLGTCWIANFKPAIAREVLALPDDMTPVAFTPLGYPADEPKEKERRPLEELVHYETW